jgi:hypothetical protein
VLRRSIGAVLVVLLLAGCAQAGVDGAGGSPSASISDLAGASALTSNATEDPGAAASLDAVATLGPSADATADATAAPTAQPTPKPTPKPTPRPTPKPTFNPNWTVTAKVGNAVLTPSAGTNVDTVTWQVLSAADGAYCELYLQFVKDGVGHSNQTDGHTYQAGHTNKWVAQLAPDQHDEIANYTLACFLGSNTYEHKHWATPGTITVQ